MTDLRFVPLFQAGYKPNKSKKRERDQKKRKEKKEKEKRENKTPGQRRRVCVPVRRTPLKLNKLKLTHPSGKFVPSPSYSQKR